MAESQEPRRWTLQDAIVGLLVVTFLAWAGVVYRGVTAVEGQLSDWRENTREEMHATNATINVMALDIALIKSEVGAIRAWQMKHGDRPHQEAIERLQSHESRLDHLEKDLGRREREKLNRAFPSR